jgi:hypothetical protein
MAAVVNAMYSLYMRINFVSNLFHISGANEETYHKKMNTAVVEA